MDNILFCEIEQWEQEYIQEKLANNRAHFIREKITFQNVGTYRETTILSPFIYSALTAETLTQLPNLKLIATRSTGVDHIDLAFCKSNGITVSNVPVYGAHTVAEHTFALILALSRKLIPSVERTRHGDFRIDGLRGFDLFGKTLGVIGAGNIGERVIAIALGFGMKILIFSKHEDDELKNNPSIQYVSLETLLSKSDIVSLHVPHTKETHHILDKEKIKQMKPGSLFINTARGPLVETEAILYGLDHSILAGVGLDVLEEECSLKEEKELLTEDFLQSCDLRAQLLNHVLLNRENVIVTPHNAFDSNEALQQILDTTILNINGFLNNQPKNVVEE